MLGRQLGLWAGVIIAQAVCRLDLSAQHVSLGNGRSVNQLNDGTGATSAIGFRGSEDLGGGLSAFFDLETKVLQDTGAAGASSSSGTFITTSQGFFSRNSYVGLKSNTFGTLTLGRYYTSIVNAIFSMNVIRTGINTGLATVSHLRASVAISGTTTRFV